MGAMPLATLRAPQHEVKINPPVHSYKEKVLECDFKMGIHPEFFLLRSTALLRLLAKSSSFPF